MAGECKSIWWVAGARLDACYATAILSVVNNAQRIQRLKAQLKKYTAQREALEAKIAAQQECLNKLLAVDQKQWAERTKSGKN